jgi:hypothetical protein
MHIKFWQQHCNVEIPKKTLTLAGFEPGIFCSLGGRDDHYATPPGQYGSFFKFLAANICIRVTKGQCYDSEKN